MSKEHVSARARYWLDDDGIIRGRSNEGAAYTYEDAVEAVAIMRDLAAGTRRALMIDITEVRSMAREARAYFQRPEHAEVLYAVALVVGSPISRAIGNFFLGLNRPVVPTQLFSDPAKATAWIRTVPKPARAT